jgi:adenylate kinase family enzyme
MMDESVQKYYDEVKNIENMNRIALIGISGAGKSTLARKLADKTGLPIFHMDPLFWKGNWEAIPEAETLEKHKELIAKDKWIIEGWIDEKMSERLQRADLIIYLDYSGIRCAWRVIKRWWKYRKESRPELPKEAKDQFLPKYFFRVVLPRAERKDVEASLKDIDQSKVVRLTSPKQLKDYIKSKFE